MPPARSDLQRSQQELQREEEGPCGLTSNVQITKRS